MLIDQDIQFSSALATFQGPDINPVAPNSFNFVIALDRVETYIQGPQFAGALVQIKKALNVVAAPVMNFRLVRSIFPFQSFVANSQVDEGDLRVTVGGLTYIFDNQFDYGNGGEFEIGTGSSWQPAGFKVPMPPAYQWTSYSIACVLDQEKKLATIQSVSVNGAKAAVVPPSLAQPAQNLGWTDQEIIVQMQCCLKAAGMMAYAWKLSLEWD